MEKVGNDVALTPKPVLGNEEAPSPRQARSRRRPSVAPSVQRNMLAWKNCYACGTSLDARKVVSQGPAVKLITSFEKDSPFEVGDANASAAIVTEHATDGQKGYAN